MIWHDVAVERSLREGEIADGLAKAFGVGRDGVLVCRCEDDFPDSAGAGVVCQVLENEDGFKTRLSIYTYFRGGSPDRVAVLGRLAKALDSRILFSDDDANPYAMDQIAPDGETSPVALDVRLLDEKGEFHVV